MFSSRIVCTLSTKIRNMEAPSSRTLAAHTSQAKVSRNTNEKKFISLIMILKKKIIIFVTRWHHSQAHFSNSNSSTLTDSRSLRRSSTSYQNRGLYLLPPTPYQPSFNNPQLPSTTLNQFGLSHLASPTNIMSHNNMASLSSPSQTSTAHQNEVITMIMIMIMFDVLLTFDFFFFRVSPPP